MFRSAIENGLECEILHYEWGRAYCRFFDFEKAQDEFTITLQNYPQHLDAKIGLALINAYKGNFELVDELKEVNGSSVFIQEAVGLERLHNGLVEDAVEMFKKALRTDKKQTYNYLNLARAFQKLGNRDKTKEYFEKFTGENPWYLDGLLEYSQWLITDGNIADAQRKLRKAEKIAPNNIEVLNLLFFTSYTLVKDNICEYNIKEALMIAEKVQSLGKFQYNQERLELETILNTMQGK